MSFSITSSSSSQCHVYKRCDVSMKWMFSKGTGSLADLGGIGSEGEYYYIPSKKPVLKAPASALGKERVIPILPRNQVLGPLGEEYLGIYEMRYRQLLNDIGEGGYFGYLYFSQSNSKLALVGTLSRVKKTERLDDGGIYVMMEGVGRFYIKDVVVEKPYLKARVQTFTDYSENEEILGNLEQAVFDEMRYSVKIMKLLYPQNNYTMNDLVLRHRPLLQKEGVRPVSILDKDSELERRSKLSFATISMLKTDPITKLVFLQEPIIEKRFAKNLKILQESTAFLEGELRKRGIVSEQAISKLRADTLSDTKDLDLVPINNWYPQNYIDGEFKMRPSLMD